MERYIPVLRQLAERLGTEEVAWVLTGSLGLYLQGIPIAVHDVDIQTDEAGAYEIERRFSESVIRQVAFSATERIRSHFGIMMLDGIEAEILGDIQNPLPDGGWTTPVDISTLRRLLDVNGLKIPVMPLDYEYDAYIRLGRTEKAALIAERLKQERVR